MFSGSFMLKAFLVFLASEEDGQQSLYVDMPDGWELWVLIIQESGGNFTYGF